MNLKRNVCNIGISSNNSLKRSASSVTNNFVFNVYFSTRVLKFDTVKQEILKIFETKIIRLYQLSILGCEQTLTLVI